MKLGLKLLALVVVALFVFTSCKRKDPGFERPMAEIDSSIYKFECKNTPVTLTEPAYFPKFPRRVVETEFTAERIALGRKLFYETKLSGDNTMSCASCHNQTLAFTDNGKAVSVGIDGKAGTKNSMALFNLAYSPAFFWDGRSTTIEAQALEPVMDPIEMHETWTNAINKLKGDDVYNRMFYEAYCTESYDSTHAADAIAQFELTLLSGNSEYDKAVAKIQGDFRIAPAFSSAEIARGYRIFNSEVSKNGGGGDCFHCHSTDNMLFTNNRFMNNGLDDNPKPGLHNTTGREEDYGKFKVPTLRNIEYTAPYMHDGRFASLEEVVEFYNSGVRKNSRNIEPIIVFGDTVRGTGNGIADGLNLTSQEKKDLVTFLKALSDKDFISNPDFSDPNN